MNEYRSVEDKAPAARAALADLRPLVAHNDEAGARLAAAILTLDHAVAMFRDWRVPGRYEAIFYPTFSTGAPVWPKVPILVGLAAIRAKVPALRAAIDTIDDLVASIAFEADCQEYTDANNTCAQYVRAAGVLAQVEAHLLAVARFLLPAG